MSIIASSTEGFQLYGEVRGSSPDWSSANFKDRGRAHTTAITPSELSSTGLNNWGFASDPSSQKGRVHYSPLRSGSLVEPAIQRGHSTYYCRRTAEAPDPSTYRPSLRPVSEPVVPDRPDRRRWVPEPHGAPPRIQGVKSGDYTMAPASSAAGPPLPHLRRPDTGATCLRECPKEYTFAKLTGSRVHVKIETYRGHGNAGDMVERRGPTARTEDTPGFFKTLWKHVLVRRQSQEGLTWIDCVVRLKDSPTFLRFVNSLHAPPEVSPHQRRMEAERRKVQAEREADRELVMGLHMEELGS